MGFTTDLPNRIDQHNSGKGSKYTATKYPVTLLWSRAFDTEYEARAFEKKAKAWGRLKKHALIQGKIYCG